MFTNNFILKNLSLLTFIFFISISNFISLCFGTSGEGGSVDHALVGTFAQLSVPINCRLPSRDGFISKAVKKELNTPKELGPSEIERGFREDANANLLSPTKPGTKPAAEGLDSPTSSNAYSNAYFRRCDLGKKKKIYVTRVECDQKWITDENGQSKFVPIPKEEPRQSYFLDLEEIPFTMQALTTMHPLKRAMNASYDHFEYALKFNYPGKDSGSINLKHTDLTKCLKNLEYDQISNIFGISGQDEEAATGLCNLDAVVNKASHMHYISLYHKKRVDMGLKGFQPLSFSFRKTKSLDPRIFNQCRRIADALNLSTRTYPPLEEGAPDSEKFFYVSRHGGGTKANNWMTNFAFTNDIKIFPGDMRLHLLKDKFCKAVFEEEVINLRKEYLLNHPPKESKKSKKSKQSKETKAQ
ncbi:MAG: hypothetical protein QE271_03865 [Bacteriovoracaceae bacterium]|nr:hypothetical protein [Bacteriovoracaceae bacterium]